MNKHEITYIIILKLKTKQFPIIIHWLRNFVKYLTTKVKSTSNRVFFDILLFASIQPYVVPCHSHVKQFKSKCHPFPMSLSVHVKIDEARLIT